MPKTALIFGAGSVGRGFIAELLSEAGWCVQFADVDERLIEALNKRGGYRHLTVSNHEIKEKWISNVVALHAGDKDAMRAAIVDADVIATSVGANVLPSTSSVLANGLDEREKRGRKPVNILICENLHDAANLLKSWIAKDLKMTNATFQRYVGLIETSIGRMIPVLTEDQRKDDPSVVMVEPYKYLPYDKRAVIGPMPDNKHFVGDLSVPFSFYTERKLYIHNMGHVFAAYIGEILGLKWIWQVLEQPAVRFLVRNAMVDAAVALASKYSCPQYPILQHIDDLLFRFDNRALQDTTERVGRDPVRKMAPSDRLIGALRLCSDQKIESPYLSLAIAAGAIALQKSSALTSDELARYLATHLDFAKKKHVNGLTEKVLHEQITSLRHGFSYEKQLNIIGETFAAPQIV